MEKKIQIQKLSFWEKCAYGLGDTSCNFFWGLIPITFIFYTDYFGITATAAGTMILVVRSLDIVFDAVIGAWADRSKKTKYGRFRPWILYGAVPLAVCTFFAYFTPNFSEPLKLVYAYITFVSFVFAYSAVNVPYGSILGVISADPDERTSVSAYKMIFAYLGLFIVSAFTLPVVEQLSKTYTPQLSFSIVASAYALVGFVFLMICFSFTKERVEPVKEEKNKLSEDFGDLIKNKPWILLSIAVVMLSFFIFVHNGMIVYYAKYYVATCVGENQFEISGKMFGLNVSWEVFSAVLFTIGSLITIIGTLIAKPLVPKFGKKNTWITCFVLASVCSAAFYFVSKESLFTIMLLQVLFSLTIGPAGFIMWSMYADVVDDSEIKTERRATGLILSSATMAQKLGTAFSALPVLLLGSIGFVANQSMSPDMQQNFLKIFAFSPIVAAAIAIIALLFYNLDDDAVKKNAETLVEVKEINESIAAAIRKKMNEQGVSVDRLAQQIKCNPNDLNKRLRNGNIQPELLLKISTALETDFFAYYSHCFRQITEKQNNTL